MPALSPTMEEGTLAKWLVKEGDSVSSGDILAEIETDKATMEFEAVDEGTIGKILVPEGTDGVKVGTVIAMMGGEGEDARPPAPAAAAEAAPTEQKAAEAEAPEPQRADRHRASSSPSAAADAADPDIPAGTDDEVDRPSAKRCATRWPRKCAATSACS